MPALVRRRVIRYSAARSREEISSTSRMTEPSLRIPRMYRSRLRTMVKRLPPKSELALGPKPKYS